MDVTDVSVFHILLHGVAHSGIEEADVRPIFYATKMCIDFCTSD